MQKYGKKGLKNAAERVITKFQKNKFMIINKIRFYFTNFFWHRTCGINHKCVLSRRKTNKEREKT